MSSPHGISHFQVSTRQRLKTFLLTHEQTIAKVEHWLHHGCVYVDGVRQRQDIDLFPEQVIRLHPQPKSFHWDKSIALKDRIIFDHQEFFALDKPAGLPVHATLDNYVENAKYILEQELEQPVYSTHRLDVPTEGLLLFAKTPQAQTLLNKTFAKRRIEKIYHALTAQPLTLGEHILYINPESRVPRETSFIHKEGWWECRLIILSSQKTAENFCHKIKLVTGKTHQIRAQLSALGAPILGDKTYGSLTSYVYERLALECYSLSFTFRSQTLTIVRSNSITNGGPEGPPPNR